MLKVANSSASISQSADFVSAPHISRGEQRLEQLGRLVYPNRPSRFAEKLVKNYLAGSGTPGGLVFSS